MNAEPTSNPTSASGASAPAVSSQGLDIAFLKRSGISIAVTVALIGIFWMMRDPAVGARYLVTGFWSLGFFAFTAIILTSVLFRRGRLVALGVIAAKLALLALFTVLLVKWPVTDAEGKLMRAHGLAMISGLMTPFVVLLLRVIAWLTDSRNRGILEAFFPPRSRAQSPDGSPSAGRMKSHP